VESSQHANRPRWDGTPGFYEIWFLVVMDPGAARAWWFRYTTFAPAPARREPPRATLWAAAFEAGAPAIAVKSILPIDAYASGPADAFAVRMGPGELTNTRARGEVRAGTHAIAWDFAFHPAPRAARRGPRLLDHLPLPTRVAHANSDIRCAGWVEVDGARHALAGAPAVQKHIWGTRRVEELWWLFCPRFAEDATVRLEASAARLRRGRGPVVTPVWLGIGDAARDWCGLPALAWNRVHATPGQLVFRGVSATRAITARAWCDPVTLAGYAYRDPAGQDLHVAQSDVASCEVDLFTRPHPLAPWTPERRLVATGCAAVEFHAPDPLPGVRYIPWDATL